MAKIERLRNSWHLTIDKISNDFSKSKYLVTVNDHENKNIYDGVELTEEAWSDLEEYFRSQRSGIIWRPFSQMEMDLAWKPRFSGMNPDYKKFARMAWDAAFEYVNDQIYKNIQQKEE